MSDAQCCGREAGCTGEPLPDHTRCANCTEVHNAREAARRAERRAALRCVVCGLRAVVVDGVALSVCKVHREYYVARHRKGAP